jgi:hypothetical protein
MVMVIDGSLGITFPDTSKQYNSYYNFKNRIINGAMVIDQRNNGASVTPSVDVFTVDRWSLNQSISGKFSFQQNAGSVTPPAGFTNYLGLTSLSSYSVLSSDFYVVQQPIEGLNVADLGWGTANAQTVTLSFWVRSSLTGTFGGSFVNSNVTRSYPFTYTISSANTWEQKTVTVAGDTTGTWLTTNGVGIRVYFGLGVGSTRSGTAGAWAGSDFRSVTGATSVVGTNGATFYITGVQLEEGIVSTPFDFRPYGTELQLAQRYFQKSYNIDVAPSTATNVGMISSVAILTDRITSAISRFPVTMRSAPTVTIYSESGTAGSLSTTAGANIGTSMVGNLIGNGGFGEVSGSSSLSVGTGYRAHWTANGEL